MARLAARQRSVLVKTLHDDALEADEVAAAQALERAFPVRLIGTFKGLVTCAHDEPIAAVLARAEVRPYDQLPVIADGRIVGLLRLGTLSPSAHDLVADRMDRLDESRLIAAEAGIMTFLLGARTSPCRLVLEGDRITGLVSKSDLQKLPVRSLLFHLVTQLELAMAAWIRRHFADDDVWLAVLNRRRRLAIAARYATLAAAELAVDQLTATMFADKRAVVLRTAVLPVSRNRAKADFEAIEVLRDAVAHIGDYALTQEAADRTIATVALVRFWSEALRSLEVDPRAPRLQRS